MCIYNGGCVYKREKERERERGERGTESDIARERGGDGGGVLERERGR